MFMKRSYLLIILLVTVWAALSKAAPAAPVRIAYSSISGAMLPLWVAKERGFFE
jgi:ABC-type nitrate/sulfonate/bicarbonate transport system substrate-binding protein